MEVSIKHYTELSKDEFHEIIALRIAVFVVEQDCPYQDLDGLDKDAYHLMVINEGQMIGTVRILKEGIIYKEVAIGRVASHPDHRDKKLGYLMMQASMEFIKEHLNSGDVRISAQTHLCKFYEKFNFKNTGKEYLEDGIPHSEMLFSSSV